ncbi:MAG: hypothetical protein U5R30_01160 [Deltaproteobacteria bacterium]|nr:hypothetical protein [Deltaproteobacteria bacterium]
MNPVAEQMFPDLCQRGAGHPWLVDWQAVLRTLRAGGAQPMVREIYFDEKWYHQTLHFVDDGRRIRIYGANITARKKIETELAKAYTEVETRVGERTAELAKAIVELKRQVAISKAAEIALHNKAMELKDQSVRLKEMNAALKVLLKQRDADKLELEEKMLHECQSIDHPLS